MTIMSFKELNILTVVRSYFWLICAVQWIITHRGCPLVITCLWHRVTSWVPHRFFFLVTLNVCLWILYFPNKIHDHDHRCSHIWAGLSIENKGVQKRRVWALKWYYRMVRYELSPCKGLQVLFKDCFSSSVDTYFSGKVFNVKIHA